MDEQTYQRIRNDISTILQNARRGNTSPAIQQSRRMLVALDWQAGRSSGDEAIAALAELVQQAPNRREAGLHLGYSSLIAFREGKVEEGIAQFQKIDETSTPAFGGFSLHAAKYVADWVHEPITMEMRMTGQPFEIERQRSLAAVEFMKSVWLPKMKASLNSGATASDLDRLNMANAAEKAIQMSAEVLARRLYLDISEATTKDILPELAALLEDIGNRFSEGAPWLQQRQASVLNKAKYVTEQLIPNVEALQAKRRFVTEFADVLATDEMAVIAAIETLGEEPLDLAKPAESQRTQSQNVSTPGEAAPLVALQERPLLGPGTSRGWAIVVLIVIGLALMLSGIVYGRCRPKRNAA
ncbi:MAG: hypothetical protein JW955_22090 [Sedimentisphaerales bacterium]|nr:hypothetical protein [Sedimentisphaerales bacterium]